MTFEVKHQGALDESSQWFYEDNAVVLPDASNDPAVAVQTIPCRLVSCYFDSNIVH